MALFWCFSSEMLIFWEILFCEKKAAPSRNGIFAVLPLSVDPLPLLLLHPCFGAFVIFDQEGLCRRVLFCGGSVQHLDRLGAPSRIIGEKKKKKNSLVQEQGGYS